MGQEFAPKVIGKSGLSTLAGYTNELSSGPEVLQGCFVDASRTQHRVPYLVLDSVDHTICGLYYSSTVSLLRAQGVSTNDKRSQPLSRSDSTRHMTSALHALTTAHESLKTIRAVSVSAQI